MNHMPASSGGHSDALIATKHFEDRSSGWVPATRVAAEFGICRRSLARWILDEATGFPRPRIVHKRLYFERTAIETWKAATAVKGVA
jgi:hypothetical protein